MNSNEVKLKNLVTTYIYDNRGMSEQEIDNIIEYFVHAPNFIQNPLTEEEINNVRKEIHAEYLIKLDLGTSITAKDFTPWFTERKKTLSMGYWNRYKEYLLRDKNFPPNVVGTMNDVTDEIVDLLGDPTLDKNFQRRGLIIGDVQSGKTANYTGLICKAADAGYKVVILLTGTIEKLRQQTQSRLDEGFIGMDSNGMIKNKENNYIGVGKYDSTLHPVVFTSKSSDFNATTAKTLGLTLNTLNEPVLFVLKKNVSVLKKLNQWLKLFNLKEGHQFIETSLLMVDDEADNASINVNDPENNPTAINTQIRTLLHLFEKASYVGFTATPFANIFIDPNTDDEMLGQDLFPKDYIYSLDAPSNYIGARNVFGENGAYQDMVEDLYDGENYFPLSHKKDDFIEELSPTLKVAINEFLLANAIRDLRGDNKKHRSMMVNTSRFVNIQDRFGTLIVNYLNEIKNSVHLYSKLPVENALSDDNIEFLYNVYNKHYSYLNYKWEEIQNALDSAIMPIDVVVVNGNNFTKLDYEEHEDTGYRVIAVGGMSLSRGLTLEGLIISYFYRNSKMYDTLMQMGRWFGYRPNYDDLCKVWMDENNKSWYQHISDATDELRRDVKRMRETDKTPMQFGLRVRNDINSLLVTARNKMRTANNAERIISLSETFLETTKLYNDEFKNKKNREIVNNLILDISDTAGCSFEESGKKRGYKNVPKELILDFLSNFNASYANFPFDTETIKNFINNYGGYELNKWDVVFINGESNKTFEIGNSQKVNCVERSFIFKHNDDLIQISGKRNRLGAAEDSKFGLTEFDIDKIKEKFYSIPENKNKSMSQKVFFEYVRNPLLMIYPIQLGKVLETDDQVKAKERLNVSNTLIGISVGFPILANSETKYAKYKINLIELKKIEEYDTEGGEESDN